MNPSRYVLLNSINALCALFTVGTAFGAQNECGATVSVLSVNRIGADTEIKFKVATTCNASTGSFEYSLRSSLPGGITSPRRVPTWKAANGSSFELTEFIPASGVISDVKVLETSITSKAT
jgi:hypothetical protein